MLHRILDENFDKFRSLNITKGISDKYNKVCNMDIKTMINDKMDKLRNFDIKVALSQIIDKIRSIDMKETINKLRKFKIVESFIKHVDIIKTVSIAVCLALIFNFCLFSPNNEVFGEYQYVIFIHAGHGGAQKYDSNGKLLAPSDTGALVNGFAEKDLNLSLAKKLEKLLKDSPYKFKIVMARDTDVFYNFAEVVGDATKAKASMILCIHHNSFKNADICGSETFYSNQNSLEFANNIQKRLVGDLGFADRGVKHFNYTSIYTPKIPSVLAEIGFMTNPNDFNAIIDDKVQDKEAKALRDAIIETLKLNENAVQQ